MRTLHTAELLGKLEFARRITFSTHVDKAAVAIYTLQLAQVIPFDYVVKFIVIF